MIAGVGSARVPAGFLAHFKLHNGDMMHLTNRLTFLVLALLIALPFTGAAAQGSLSVPFAGTATPQNAAAVPITGTFNITSFAVNNGQVVANGTLNFLLNGVQQVVQAAVAVTQATGSCPILNLTLGPLHLDLLGLVIDLNQIHLTITAQSGPGNLLGNLLCAVANLLNNNGGLGNLVGGLLNQLATLLNQLLGQL